MVDNAYLASERTAAAHALDAGAQRQVDSAAMTRIVLRPMASPLPLGFLALAVGSLLFSALQLGWIPLAESSQVATTILVFVVPLELLSAIVSFLIRDVVMATGFGLLTGSWFAVARVEQSGAPGATSHTVGLLAISVAVALLIPAITAAPAKPVATVLMAVAATRFALTGVYELTADNAWKETTGIIGLVLVATAAYGTLALSLEDARHRAILPISRRTTSRAAMSGEIGAQIESIATEAGVRQES
jgi:hypothetical protein